MRRVADVAAALIRACIFAGYLLGFGILGCGALYFLISLMSDSHDSLPAERIVSVLG